MSDALRGWVNEVVVALAPLVDAAGDADAMRALLSELGWTPASIPKPLSDLATAGADLTAIIGADSDSVSFTQVLDAVAHVVDAIETIHAQSDSAFPSGIDVASFKSTIGSDLLDYVLVEHLLQNRHRLGGALRLAGLIRLVDTPAVGLRKGYLRRGVAWSDICDLITDPAKGFRSAFGWETTAPAMTEALGVLASWLESFGLQFSYLQPDPATLDFSNTGATGPSDALMGIDLAFSGESGAPSGFNAGLQFLVRPPTSARGSAIALLPYADLVGTQELVIADNLSLTVRGDADFTKGIAITLAPGHPIEFQAGFLGGAAVGPAEAQLGLKVAAPADAPERVLIGSADASRLSAHGATLAFGARVVSPTSIDAFVEINFDQARVVIKPAPGESDSFLASLLGDAGISAELSLGLRLSSVSGFHLSGAADLQVTTAVGIHLGPIDIQSISIGLRPSSDCVAIEIGAAIHGSIGPVSVVVDRVGFSLTARFPDPPTGNLGPLDVGFGFLPPLGIGVSIDAGSVLTGGGFIYHDPVRQMYAGALQLSLHERITLKAFGLLATVMPDGSRGYSLIVFITAEGFQPIQLGMGFTLSGIGGMVAIHRTFDEDVLRAGLKSDTLGSLLFPRDPVGNAPALITALAAAFPAKQGSYLLGLLVRIGWFTPPLVLLDLALILEFGARTRLLVLGRISALLPSPDNDLVRLILDSMGVIDFDQGTASIDAVLVDSRLAHKFAMTGAMALRARWSSGPGSGFILAVGGLNPHFAPPEGLPALQRVGIALSSGDNPRLNCDAYFAITSNTVQFGAHAQLYAAAYGFSVEGDIGFDVLIQIAPLHFIADFNAKVQLKHGSSNLFMVSVDGELEGPRPLRVSGKASFSIFWCDFSVRFDRTLVDGEAPPPPPAIDVLAQLKAALAQPQSWTAQRAPGHTQGVALRALPPGSTQVVLDPLGRLLVKQQVVPLNTGRNIEIFGGAPVTGAKRFQLKATLNGTEQHTDNVRDQFAPATFFELSDDEKLAAPSFETMDAGLVFGDAAVSFDATQAIAAPLEYEQIVIDDLAAPPPQQPPPKQTYTLRADKLIMLSRSGAAARAPIRSAGLARFRTADAAPAATLEPPSWRIVPLADGTPAALDPAIKTWSEHLAALTSLNRGAASWQIVPAHELTG